MIIAYLLHTFADCEDTSSAASPTDLFLPTARPFFGSTFTIVGGVVEIVSCLSELENMDYILGEFRVE